MFIDKDLKTTVKKMIESDSNELFTIENQLASNIKTKETEYNTSLRGFESDQVSNDRNEDDIAFRGVT